MELALQAICLIQQYLSGFTHYDVEFYLQRNELKCWQLLHACSKVSIFSPSSNNFSNIQFIQGVPYEIIVSKTK